MVTCFTYNPVVFTSLVWLVARHIFIHTYYQVYIPMHTNIHYDNRLYISSCIHMPTHIYLLISPFICIYTMINVSISFELCELFVFQPVITLHMNMHSYFLVCIAMHIIIHYDNHWNLSPSIHMPTYIFYSTVMYMYIHCANHFF